MLFIREIAPTYAALQAFVRFPETLYRGDPEYIPTFVGKQVRAMVSRRNSSLADSVQCFLMAYDGDTPVGRIMVGIDFRTLQRSGERQGYFSLFECIDSQEAANLLLDAAKMFLKLNGITALVGPMPAVFREFGTGLLVMGNNKTPSILSPYNPSYYETLLTQYGFITLCDFESYEMPVSAMGERHYENIMHRAGKRFGYTVQSVNLKKDTKLHARQIARVIAESTPQDFASLPPTAEQLRQEFINIYQLLTPEYTYMAFAGERPIGVLIGIPDQNLALKHLKKSIPPISWVRFLVKSGQIDRVRTIFLYIVPDYQNKGVEAVMIQQALDAAVKNGIKTVEGAMISDKTPKMRLIMEKMGGQVTKRYRQYRMEI